MTRLLLVLGMASAACAGGGPENVLVVQNDLCPDSIEVARYYVWKRDVPRHHVVHVRIPGAPVKVEDKKKKDPKAPAEPTWQPRESFASYDEFKTLLQDPVRAWIERHPKSRITTIVLTRGIPVCSPTKNAKANEIVRSTTHMLGGLFVEADEIRTGPEGHIGVASPFYKCDVSIDPASPIDGKWKMMSVGLLDAFSVDEVKKSVDLSIVSDTKRPDGRAYLGLSAEKDPRGMYTPNFPKLTSYLEGLGWKAETITHRADQILLEGKKDVALYLFGQANWNEAFPGKNSYQPGCLVDNITSVALTWRAFTDPPGGGQTQMTYFLRAGATVVHGCVREPTTGAWDPEYLHAQRFTAGYNVIESFVMGHPWYPWMNLVAGDPLTQPFAVRPEVKAELAGAKGAWVLKASASAKRDGAKIGNLRVHLDGVEAGEVGESGEFALPAEFDPANNAWKVVATDDSKFRTQGFASSAPPKLDATKLTAKLDGYFKGSASIKLGYSGGIPLVTWIAPDSKERTGTVRSYRFTIPFESDAEPHTVELWVRNAKGDAPVVLTVEVPAKKK